MSQESDDRLDVEKMIAEGYVVSIPDTDPPTYKLTEAGIFMEQRALLATCLNEIHEAIAGIHDYADSVREGVALIADNRPFDASGQRIQTPEPPSAPSRSDVGYL